MGAPIPGWLPYVLMAGGAVLLVASALSTPTLGLIGMVIGILLAITGVILAMTEDSLESFRFRRRAHR